VKFVSINVSELDAFKHAAIPVIADAGAALDELIPVLAEHVTTIEYREQVSRLAAEWRAEVDRLFDQRHSPLMSQAEVIGVVNHAARPRDVVVCAAGSLPGELHKLWRSREPNAYHLEYGYSCMGYEIAGGLGVKMADPDRDVYVMVGDGSYLMLAQEIVTSIQEGHKLIVVLADSSGFASIGALSRSVGSNGFGTRYRFRDRATGTLSGDVLPVDLATNAESLGAEVHRALDRASLVRALDAARTAGRTTVIYVPVDPDVRVPGYEAWWDVPVAEVSEQESVRQARKAWEAGKRRERYFL
jgi:3D-(3,5/4)-trihydroxycyclohexane-1,2-dione acylhydrolase (decyclizing)